MAEYQIGRLICAGATAEIFRGTAVADSGFEKPVVIKRIRPGKSQEERFIKLLIEEAKILAQVRHRNIVQIFDVGLEGGKYSLVMEYVEGADLEALSNALTAKNKRLPLDLALYLGAEVCEALEHAHQAPGPEGHAASIVHRDVSPGNILLSYSGEVKLTDFGIAQRREGSARHHLAPSKSGYISPEQAARGKVDARSDIYSLGVVLFELIIGRRLFSGVLGSEAHAEALRAAARDGKIPRPRDLDRTIDPELEEILLKALAKAPEDRYSSAGELGSRLRDFRYGLSVSADPAQGLSQVLTHFVPPEHHSEREPTVVRIRTAVGFEVPGFSFAEEEPPVAAARTPVRHVDESDTDRLISSAGRNGHLPAGSGDPVEQEIEERLGVAPLSPDLCDMERGLFDVRVEPGRDTDRVFAISSGAVAEKSRAATPTMPEFLASESVAVPEREGLAATARRTRDDSEARRNGSGPFLFFLAAVAVAVASFVVTSLILSW